MNHMNNFLYPFNLKSFWNQSSGQKPAFNKVVLIAGLPFLLVSLIWSMKYYDELFENVNFNASVYFDFWFWDDAVGGSLRWI